MIIHICHSLALALALVSTSFDFSEGTPESDMSFNIQTRYSVGSAWKNASHVYQGNDVQLTCSSQDKSESLLRIRRLRSKNDTIVEYNAGITTYKMENIQCHYMDTYVCEDSRGANKTLELGIYKCAPLPCNGTTNKTIFVAVNESTTFNMCVITYPNISSQAIIDGNVRIRNGTENADVHWSWAHKRVSFNMYIVNITIRNASSSLYREHIFSIPTYQKEKEFLKYIFDIKEPKPPECPNDFNITSPGLTNVTIAWRPGFDGGSSQWFDVSYKINNETVEEWSPTSEVSESYVEVTGLQAGTNYVLKVEPRNKYHRNQCTSFIFHTESSPPTESNDSTKDDEDKNLMIAIILSVVVLAVTVCIATIVGIILYKKIRKLYFRVRVPKDPMTTTTPNNPRVQYLHRENNNRTFDSAERHLLDSSISSGNTTLDVGGFNSRAPHA